MGCMYAAGTAVNQPPASHGEDHPAGGDEVAVEAFNQGHERGPEYDIDDPARADGAMKRDRGHEFFAG